MKGSLVIKIAALIFIAVSVIHLINFLVGGVISVWGFAIPSNISLFVTLILGFLAFKLVTLK
tara:strand:- start:368 stop:553 length:186 start_codon:yes stop_codon:yes gene_type:complete